MAKVVMLTAMAGVGIDLQCGDVFETDDATAARLLETGAAREETQKDKLAPVKTETKPPVVDTTGEDDEANDGEDESSETNPEPAARRTSRRR